RAARPDSPTLSLHDALPICTRGRTTTEPRGSPEVPRDPARPAAALARALRRPGAAPPLAAGAGVAARPRRRRPGRVLHPALLRRSEEHTSELQSRENLVCRL